MLVVRVIAMQNPGGVAHAKASLCMRESLDAVRRHVTMCVTSTDGTQFLYRSQTNGETIRIYADAPPQKTSVPKGQFPCWLKIVRRGREFSGYECTDGQNWQLSGEINLDLAAETVVGLAASSHRGEMLTKATFDQVKVSQPPAAAIPESSKNRASQLVTVAIDGTDKHVVYQTSQRIEAPNWSPDGKWLVFNSNGFLWHIPAGGARSPNRFPPSG